MKKILYRFLWADAALGGRSRPAHAWRAAAVRSISASYDGLVLSENIGGTGGDIVPSTTPRA